jgi:ATP-dependent RNA helicase DDX55/SPB4
MVNLLLYVPSFNNANIEPRRISRNLLKDGNWFYLDANNITLVWHSFCLANFRDKAREKQRKKALKRKAEEEAQNSKPEKKRAPEKPEKPKRKKTGKQRQSVQTKEDLDELTHEYRLLKKLKRGAIDEEEYEKLTGFVETDGEGSSDSDASDLNERKERGNKAHKKFKQRGKGTGGGSRRKFEGKNKMSKRR